MGTELACTTIGVFVSLAAAHTQTLGLKVLRWSDRV